MGTGYWKRRREMKSVICLFNWNHSIKIMLNKLFSNKKLTKMIHDMIILLWSADSGFAGGKDCVLHLPRNVCPRQKRKLTNHQLLCLDLWRASETGRLLLRSVYSSELSQWYRKPGTCSRPRNRRTCTHRSQPESCTCWSRHRDRLWTCTELAKNSSVSSFFFFDTTKLWYQDWNSIRAPLTSNSVSFIIIKWSS